MKFGVSEEIRSDNGSEYINTELTHLCNCLKSNLNPVQPMHPGPTV